jgi:hypothetical protein
MTEMMRPSATGSAVAVFLETEPIAIQTRKEWRFELGQCISHKDQAMPSLVVDRARTSKGREVYVARSYALVDPVGDRMMLADVLVDVVPGSEPCMGCALFRTAMCPARR